MAEQLILGAKPAADFPERIRKLRGRLELTQQSLADRLRVSFATVNRWENGQSTPSALAWNRLHQLEREREAPGARQGVVEPERITPVTLDFTTRPEIVKVLAEGERLSFGHLSNPAFAAEISCIDPLPHQRIAVYDRMLGQPRLRFLLADDAGAGKTIMAGLYIREMLSRRLLSRVLIVAPAGLVGNWQRELRTLFDLSFRILSGADVRHENPFAGENSHQVIISVDTLASPRVIARLGAKEVEPYDLAVFDEAHKLAADRGSDLRVRRTDRYRLAEALAGAPVREDRWRLGWHANHLLLLTATPHMGKDYPYFALWRLLEPDALATPEAFHEYPPEQREAHFIRRTKEEMVTLDGRPLYTRRTSDTLGYELSRGAASEQALYEETTDYLRFVYNKAKLLNREAARLAMSVFQRRLASSTYALLRSLERRVEKLDRIIADIQDGKLTAEQLVVWQQRTFEEEDLLDTRTADEEEAADGMEENEAAEGKLLEGVIASSLADLLAEREQVLGLLAMARKVHALGRDSKFEKLRDLLADPRFREEKLIVFTEHRDTLEFLAKSLAGLGYTGQVARIHGGMPYRDRDEEVEHFRKPAAEGGAKILVCTDAAGEGINLQFCRIMLNYDIPWNPARLEQRMGRIHRYKQKHDVVILNLVAPATREGKVLKTLLDKLERIRQELQSDKVFDCVGRVFEGVPIKRYMEMAVTGNPDEVARALDGRLTPEQVEALAARERSLYGAGGDVGRELPRLQAGLDREVYFRLMPGYVRQYLGQAAPLVGIAIESETGGSFTLRPRRPGALDPLLPALELYPEDVRERFTVSRPAERAEAVWLHPGEPVFERFRRLIGSRLGAEGRRGAVFVDPGAEKPYFLHVAILSVVRRADAEVARLAREEVLECRLVGIRQMEGAEIAPCPVEHLLLLRGGHGLPPAAQRLALAAEEKREEARAYLAERVAREMALQHRRRLLDSLPGRESLIRRGFDLQEAELAAVRCGHAAKARSGNPKAAAALEEVKGEQRLLAARRGEAVAALRREPELVMAGEVAFVTHALVVPSSDPLDRGRHDADVEAEAMRVARAFEEAAGARVLDVHTPELARAAGLPENPGFDLLSLYTGNEKRAIEVKGRAGTGEVEITENEWSKACNLRDSYWLYVVFDCGAPNPRMARVRDPWGRLLARLKGSVMLAAGEILEAAEG